MCRAQARRVAHVVGLARHRDGLDLGRPDVALTFFQGAREDLGPLAAVGPRTRTVSMLVGGCQGKPNSLEATDQAGVGTQPSLLQG